MNVVFFGTWVSLAADAILLAILVLLGALILLSLARRAAELWFHTDHAAVEPLPAIVPILRVHHAMRAANPGSVDMPSRAPPATVHLPADAPDVEPSRVRSG